MAQLMTRPEFRDAVRRDLQIVPPIDTGDHTAYAGQQPTYAPNPTNTQINQCIQQAISDINRFTSFHVNQFSVSIPAASSGWIGPYATSLSSLSSAVAAGAINTIKRALWTSSESSSVPVLLWPTTRDALDRGENNSYYNTAAGQPQMWWIEAYAIYLSPAPSPGGVLTLTAGTGVLGLQTEGDTLDQMPVDFQYVVEYQTIVRLSKLSTMDVEAQERAAMFAPDAIQGMKQFKAWVDGQMGPTQIGLGFVNDYRRGYGTRRTRR